MFRKKILLAVFLVQALSLLASAVYADGLARTTGSAHYYNVYNGRYVTNTISAIEHADGSVSGQVQIVSHGDPIVHAHIAVDCLRVVEYPPLGNLAYISGWLTHAVTPSPPPKNLGYATFLVFDGGEGPESLDRITSAIVVSDPELWNCEKAFFPGPWFVWTPLHGNIQVSP
jgi:hypothetical protein